MQQQRYSLRARRDGKMAAIRDLDETGTTRSTYLVKDVAIWWEQMGLSSLVQNEILKFGWKLGVHLI